MNFFLLLPILISADLIAFNRYKNTVQLHMDKRYKPSDMKNYLRLQMMLYKLENGKMDFVTKMMNQINNEKNVQDDNEAADSVNFRLKKFLERNTSSWTVWINQNLGLSFNKTSTLLDSRLTVSKLLYFL